MTKKIVSWKLNNSHNVMFLSSLVHFLISFFRSFVILVLVFLSFRYFVLSFVYSFFLSFRYFALSFFYSFFFVILLFSSFFLLFYLFVISLCRSLFHLIFLFVISLFRSFITLFFLFVISFFSVVPVISLPIFVVIIFTHRAEDV
jgi:hypothetical protein